MQEILKVKEQEIQRLEDYQKKKAFFRLKKKQIEELAAVLTEHTKTIKDLSG